MPYDGKGVNVYVMDTGIRYSHEEFEGRAHPLIDTSSGKFVKCEPDDYTCAADVYGHGTHCAGTVGGKISGVAKKVTMYSAKVIDDDKVGWTSRINRGIIYITNHGIKPAVMTMSVGSPGSRSVTMMWAIQAAEKKGIAAVVAAGNSCVPGKPGNCSACSQSPAYIDEAITVSATDKADSRDRRYANFGECVDIFAPGFDVKSADGRKTSNTNSGMWGMSGTSMATPHVTGVVAMLLQINKNIMPAEIKQALVRFGTKGILKNIGEGSPNLMLHLPEKWGPGDGFTKQTTTTTTTTTQKPRPRPRPKDRRRRRSRRKGSDEDRRRRRSRKGSSSRRRRRS
jgi:subtilisin family serine protease